MAERPLAVASGFVGGNGKKEERYYASEQTGNSDRANRRKRKLRTERKEPALRPISGAPNDNNIKITVMAMDVGEAKKKLIVVRVRLRVLVWVFLSFARLGFLVICPSAARHVGPLV